MASRPSCDVVQCGIDSALQVVRDSIRRSLSVETQSFVDFFDRLRVKFKQLHALLKILFHLFRATSRGIHFTFPERISSERLSNSAFQA